MLGCVQFHPGEGSASGASETELSDDARGQRVDRHRSGDLDDKEPLLPRFPLDATGEEIIALEQVFERYGIANIRAFWLAGHSQGGMTSHRLLREDRFFQDRVDGFVSLSGGRIGPSQTVLASYQYYHRQPGRADEADYQGRTASADELLRLDQQ